MDADVAAIAKLFADHTRATVLATLMSGRAHTAGELANEAGVAPSTMSAHLNQLLAVGAIETVAQGRHRYVRLADPRLADVFEALALAAPAKPVRSLRTFTHGEDLRRARSCYDHLAGQVAVEMADGLFASGAFCDDGDGLNLTDSGGDRLRAVGVDVDAARARAATTRRRFATRCLDWSERTDHLAGALGAAILTAARDHGWVASGPVHRSLAVTPAGEAVFDHLSDVRAGTAAGDAARTVPQVGRPSWAAQDGQAP